MPKGLHHKCKVSSQCECTARIITLRFLLVSSCKYQQIFNVSLHLMASVLNTSVF